MKFAPFLGALSAAWLLAGCAGSSIALRTSTAPAMHDNAPPAGTSYSSGTIHAELSSTPYFGLLFLGFAAAAIQDNYFAGGYGPASRTPPLAEDRTVAERDCRRPLEAISANLRCK